MFMGNMGTVVEHLRAGPPSSKAVTAGLMMGFIIGECWNQSPAFMEQHLEQYIAYKSKERGENVTSFYDAKARK